MSSKREKRHSYAMSIIGQYGQSANCPKCGRVSEVSGFFGIPCGKCQRRDNIRERRGVSQH